MATWSMPLQPQQQGWKLRVLSGTSLGREIDLSVNRYILGSRTPAHIVIPDSSISPQHVTIDIRPDRVIVTDCSRGAGMTINGNRVATAQVAPGDHIQVGNFKFEFTNPNYTASPSASRAGSVLQKVSQFPLHWRVGAITLAVATLLYLLLVLTLNPYIVPVTLVAMSAVVPATMICYLVDKFDTTGISFHTLAITFLAGGTLGIVSAVLNGVVVELLLGEALLFPIFAGLYEEPAKFLATAWRWHHPRYDRPLDGLIIGTVSGFGFAMFETAGYGFSAMADKGLGHLLIIMLVRSISTPFGHGIWSGIVASAFWQQGRSLKRAMQSRSFGIACLWAIGLHGLWNAGTVVASFGYGISLLSAVLSVREYRKLLANKGYRR